MSLNLFIIGPSGCGKTTQAKKVAEKYGLTHISMGQLLRDEIQKGSGFGIEAKKYVEEGVWVPDDLTFDVLINTLKTIQFQNFVIDGLPRLLNQGRIIEHYLRKLGQPFSLLIHLNVTFEEIMKRRAELGENFQDKTRIDNSPEDIIKKQQTYNETIGPIKEYFTKVGKLVCIDGNRPIDPIFEDICIQIDKLV